MRACTRAEYEANTHAHAHALSHTHTCARTHTQGADASLVNQRLKEMFKKNIYQLREAVYRLLGYKVDMYPGPKSSFQVKLRCMYAESEDDYLLFQMSQTGQLDLLESPYAKSLDPNLCLGLNVFKSFPIFTGDITRHLFENMTKY